jgi:hypothetical protein
VVIERDDVEDQFLQRRMFGSQQRLRASRAFLKMQPDHRRSLRLFNGIGDCRFSARRQTHRRCHSSAKLHELAPRNLQALFDAAECIFLVLHVVHVVVHFACLQRTAL